MPQPHITDETYKGLTPDEQAKYEAKESWRFFDKEHASAPYQWIDAHASDYDYYNNDFFEFADALTPVETQIVHYLKPVEAQQSEGEGFDSPYQDLFTHMYRDHNLTLLESEMSDMVEAAKPLWQGEITALQQEVERLKAELETLRNTLFQTLRESTIHGYTYCQHIVDKVLPPTK